MALSFNQQALKARLERLDSDLRAEFALTSAERLLPYYQQFHDQTGQGDPRVLADALRSARARLAGDGTTSIDPNTLADRCEALVPVEDDSWTDLSGLAQNAAAAAAYALRTLESGAVDQALWAAVQGYEAADLIASTDLNVDFNEPGVEDRLLREDVVQQELAAQEDLMRRLEETGQD